MKFVNQELYDAADLSKQDDASVMETVHATAAEDPCEELMDRLYHILPALSFAALVAGAVSAFLLDVFAVVRL